MSLKFPKTLQICVFIFLGVGLWGCKKDNVEIATHVFSNQEEPVAIARGKTDVEGGLITLSFPLEGVIQKVLVREGQIVQPGQLLMQQDTRMFLTDKSIAESELAIANLQLQGLKEQIPELKQKVERLNMAAQAGASQMQLTDEASNTLKQIQTEVAVAKAQVNLSKNKLSQILARGEQLNLRAPFSGTVVKINAQSGEFLSSSHPLMVLLPNKPAIIRAELNESYLTSVKIGMQAKVQIDSDNQRINLPDAHVIRISPIYMQSQLQSNAQHISGRVVECILEFNTTPPTRVGQNVMVSFYSKS